MRIAPPDFAALRWRGPRDAAILQYGYRHSMFRLLTLLPINLRMKPGKNSGAKPVKFLQ
jgi:hypothetical protein